MFINHIKEKLGVKGGGKFPIMECKTGHLKMDYTTPLGSG